MLVEVEKLEQVDYPDMPEGGVIDPRETRNVLATALAACGCAPLRDVGYGVFRM